MGHHPPFSEVEASRADFDERYEPNTTKVPQPEFKLGGGLNNLPYANDFKPEVGRFKTLLPEDCEKASLYKLLISAITPRPISFTSTLSPEGIPNLAPMSYFNVLSHDPPTVVISVQGGSSKYADKMKDTNHNIKQTEEFCISIISELFLEASNYTSIDAPNDVDEWKLSGLTKRKSETVKPPHVAESAFSMECKLMHWYDIKADNGEVSNSCILGRVTRIHMKEFALDPEDPMKMLTEKLRPISRLGGIAYGRTTQMMEIPRPRWEDVKDTPDVKAALSADDKSV